MIQKKIQAQEGKKEKKKISLKELKEKFVEETPSPYIAFDRRGIRQSTGKTEFVQTGHKIKMERGMAPDDPARRSHIGNPSTPPQSKELISIDRSGRLVLPKKIRNLFDANRFEVRVTEDHIELIPIKPLHTLLGSLPDIDIDKIYREHDQDVEEEDEEL
ncbi:MAG: hypothetical protein LUQ04_01490 [Methanoregula sp.]|nr:hypothetical protein [Methanoregula sp.]